MAQVQRPLIIQSQIIRLCCPRTSRRTSNSAFARFQARKLHTETVTDNDISRLASLPLHPLTLADLVKYGSRNNLSYYRLTSVACPDTVDHRSQHSNYSPPQTSRSRSYLRDLRTASNRSETCPSSSFRIHTCPRYIPTTYTVSQRCCHGPNTR